MPLLPSRPRASSFTLPQAELIEIRAAQRTFEGAYIRTALGQFSFALVVLKIFTPEFYPIGTLFAVFALCLLGVSRVRRREGNQLWREVAAGVAEGERKFRTSGNVGLRIYCGGLMRVQVEVNKSRS